MAPFRNYDDSDDDSDEGLITVVSAQVPGPQEEEEYPCQQCPENRRPVFRSHAELVKHKIQAEHQYCKKCDQEFADRDDLEIHILRSNRHITCFVCVKEFRSESGLQFHTQQAHQTSAGGICPQCHENFNTQAGLLQHIEGNLCPGGLRRSDIYEAIEDHQQQTNEELRNRSTNTTQKDTEEPTPTQSENPAIELVNSFSHFKILDQRATGSTRPEGEIIDVDPKWWDKERRHYVCPYRSCRRKFKYSEPFRQHLNSDAHSDKIFNCPGCKKRFTSSSAMLQHIESRMCRIVQMPDYDRVRGGLTVPVDQSRLSHSLATMSHRSETLSTVGVLSDTGDNSSTVGARTATGMLNTVGARPTAAYNAMSGRFPAGRPKPERGGNFKEPPSTAGGSDHLTTVGTRSERLSTVGTNQNQFAEGQLQQLKHAWAEPSREGGEGGELAQNKGSKGKGEAKHNPSDASNAITRRNAAENRKPKDGVKYSFGNDSDEEGTMSTVI
ncbi:hypothetical protein EYR41_001411 [Orbilia oligospora]|uniref:Uncharacterized protein n=1 Tax=Orbilia oligospora TaxID=2813651 RepID=A0A7C8K815_ORBOL|nr:hypothetical protein TWF751_009735 [Orbilia oligospora]KAF3291686.1 hypothetical protein TWF132_006669 [Orbilia oligospora]TGJ74403.1 hypothetical protein EYR41_001411 [Orbilia oligospora]